MELGRSLLILATFLQVASSDADDADRYALPLSKVYIEPCKKEALILHPGVIEKQQMLHRYGNYWVEYGIQAHDGSEWFVLCDLSTGKINSEQKLVDDVF